MQALLNSANSAKRLKEFNNRMQLAKSRPNMITRATQLAVQQNLRLFGGGNNSKAKRARVIANQRATSKQKNHEKKIKMRQQRANERRAKGKPPIPTNNRIFPKKKKTLKKPANANNGSEFRMVPYHNKPVVNQAGASNPYNRPAKRKHPSYASESWVV